MFQYLTKGAVAAVVVIALSCKENNTPDITGAWVGTEWYCTNTQDCVVNEGDNAATLSFDIISNSNGELTLSKGTMYLPSCVADPNCTAEAWQAEEATFIEGKIFIRWSVPEIEYEGTYTDKAFTGNIYVRSPPFDYLFNDNVVISRKK